MYRAKVNPLKNTSEVNVGINNGPIKLFSAGLHFASHVFVDIIELHSVHAVWRQHGNCHFVILD